MKVVINNDHLKPTYMKIDQIPYWKLFGVKDSRKIGIVLPTGRIFSDVIFWLHGAYDTIGYDFLSELKNNEYYRDCFILAKGVEVTLSN
jgi:hypothetical protein